jgi:Kef-type K+ transport system membrane component KefB
VTDPRRAISSLAVADVVLFLIAVAFNDHSNTSVDGIVWWVALLVFVLLILAGMVVLGQFVRNRARRPPGARRRRART